MFPESGCSDQKLPLPGLSGVRGTLTKQSLKDSECLGGFHFQELVNLVLADGSWKKKNLTEGKLFENQPSIHQHSSFFYDLIPYRILPPYGILPPLLILSIERKQLHDESVNLGKCQHLALRVLDRHRDQRDQAGRERILRG